LYALARTFVEAAIVSIFCQFGKEKFKIIFYFTHQVLQEGNESCKQLYPIQNNKNQSASNIYSGHPPRQKKSETFPFSFSHFL